jgi:gas vesicle protein
MARKQGGILILLGALIGAITALFFSTTEEGEMKEPVRYKVKMIKEKMKDVDIKKQAQEIFGARGAEWVALLQETKDDLAERLGTLKGSLDKIDKQKYADAVNNLMAEMKKNSKVTADQARKLKTYLTEDYQKLKKA